MSIFKKEISIELKKLLELEEIIRIRRNNKQSFNV